MQESTGSIEHNGKRLETPVLQGTQFESALDISKLRSETGMVTLDVGYVNTASCTSTITYLNGEKGILQFRGIPIDVLADESHFLETAFLLLNGSLPTTDELSNFAQKIAGAGASQEKIEKLIKCFEPTAHPMGVLSACLASLQGFYPELAKEDLSPEELDQAIAVLLGQMKNIMSAFYRHSIGAKALASDIKKPYVHDFLGMMFGTDTVNWGPEVFKALDTLLLLHADHGQNCSTATVRTVASAKSNIFACIASGVNALWGSLHGGANQAVLEMLEAIAADGGDVDKYIAKAKDKADPFRLMGFGHRVYKNFDPRAKIIKQASAEVLSSLGVKDPLLDIARGLEKAALEDEYFVERKLYPNVDFYSGIIYRALGIPTNMFTVLFALGRLPGWLAQWKELRTAGSLKITRPRQIYMGETHQSYTPIEERS